MKPLIIALDVETDKEAVSLIKATQKHCDVYKIGPGLVLRYGPTIFQKIHKLKKKIFLDLKFHDIPNTMMRSIAEAGKNRIYSATVHTSAGATALRAVSEVKRRPLLWGVTILTSLTDDDLSHMGFRHATVHQVGLLAGLAKQTHLDGVVASVGETAPLREALGRSFQIITPGIRLPGHTLGDQKRVATPQTARAAGSSFIVVGRPILEAKEPNLAAAELLKDWKRI